MSKLLVLVSVCVQLALYANAARVDPAASGLTVTALPATGARALRQAPGSATTTLLVQIQSGAGACLTLPSDRDGAVIFSRPCDDRPRQLWTVELDDATGNAVFVSSKGTCMTIASSGLNGNLFASACTRGANQQFTFTDNGAVSTLKSSLGPCIAQYNGEITSTSIAVNPTLLATFEDATSLSRMYIQKNLVFTPWVCGVVMEGFGLYPGRTPGRIPNDVQQKWFEANCDVKLCSYFVAKYGIVVGKNWGSLPSELQGAWFWGRCHYQWNTAAAGVLTQEDATQNPVYGPWGCGVLAMGYELVSGIQWGSLPGELQAKWVADGCDNKVCSFLTSKHDVLPGEVWPGWDKMPDVWKRSFGWVRPKSDSVAGGNCDVIVRPFTATCNTADQRQNWALKQVDPVEVGPLQIRSAMGTCLFMKPDGGVRGFWCDPNNVNQTWFYYPEYGVLRAPVVGKCLKAGGDVYGVDCQTDDDSQKWRLPGAVGATGSISRKTSANCMNIYDGRNSMVPYVWGCDPASVSGRAEWTVTSLEQ